MQAIRYRPNSSECGSALIAAAVTTIIVAAMAAALLSVTSTSRDEQSHSGEGMKALFVAEAGVNQALASLRAGQGVTLGTQATPVAFSDGSYWGTSVDNTDGTWTLTAFGTSSRRTRGIEVVLTGASGGVFSNALFAGNSSGDPLYELSFGGTKAQADFIDGNVYSGGSIRLRGDSFITGEARAVGGVHGGGGGGASPAQGVPDIAGTNYPKNNDFDVASLFGSATYQSSKAYGGTAWQMPESSPAHIFRKNPTDRSSDTSKTVKDDYFLEDPYEAMNTSGTIKPSSGSKISLSGVGGKPGVTGNEAVYYIDGNLWVHNRSAYSFTLDNPGTEALRITLVVSGNVYYSDNVMYGDPKNDGLAIIAIKDSGVPDSGNIYFGDPVFGTLERMDSFMYAENDFYDSNLSAKGSARVTVNGNMTAGNHVRIDRDVGGQHSKLTVNFDGRISSGGLTLPGLPQTPGSTPLWTLLSWREVAAP